MSNFINRLTNIEQYQADLKNKLDDMSKRITKLELDNGKMNKNDAIVKHESNQVKEKSANQLKKEAKNKEKNQRFQEKMRLKEANATTRNMNDKSAESKKKVQKPVEENVKYISNTKPGEKKDTKCQLPNAYNPKYVEAAWYDWWEKMEFFKPECAEKYFKISDGTPREKFVIAMPPPNVTGTLHLGHALMCAIEDTLTRWHRMLGHETLWCPGFDHAGIATQVVVEKKIKREQNKSRHDLGREAFLKEIWKWKDEKGETIVNQLKSMGSSCDWDRKRFTMDDVSVKAVLEAFIRMHEKGLIYRSKRLVNWSCALNSAISDIEVDKVPLKGRTLLAIPGYKERIEFGTLTSYSYRVADDVTGEPTSEEIVVATTRPETMLGDTAIAVNPNDERYKLLVGRYAIHPFIETRKLPIIADDMVDTNYGTGAVKITPAHDANDFECGKRHNLPFITVINDQGFINSEGGPIFAGMKRFDARKEIVKQLKEKGLFKEIKDTETVLPLCSRSKDVIEPLMKSQWYVNCKEMASKAVKLVKDKSLKIVPDFHEQVWFRWLEDIHDWCISRQLWWGHRIPAYHIKIDGLNSSTLDDTDNNYWVSAHSYEEALQKAYKRFPEANKSKIKLSHDEDVLDTWFSSGIFPFSICGWPEKTSDMNKYYPGSLLETGHDILFFWVARMVMMGEELTNQLPFDKVYLHAIIRDSHGRKMSKSLGNIIDPLDVIQGISLEKLHEQLSLYNLDPKEIEKAIKGQKEDYPNGIPECGTDALRFALCAYTGQGRDINLDVLRIQGYRHFGNKLWNATRFAMINGLGEKFIPQTSIQYLKDNYNSLRYMDKWILSRLSDTVTHCNIGLREFDFTSTTTSLFNFWLYDLCDYYIEYLKPSFYNKEQTNKHQQESNLSREVLYTCLDAGLLLISPIMPFISEELYQRLPRRQPDTDAPSICVTQYPLHESYGLFRDLEIEENVKLTQDAINKIRSLRADYQLTPSTKTEIYIQTLDHQIHKSLSNLVDFIQIMANCKSTIFIDTTKRENVPIGCALTTLSDKCKLYLMLKGIIDIQKEELKLLKKKEKLNQQIATLKKDQSQSNYEQRVPDAVRQKSVEKLHQLENEVQLIDEGLKQLKEMK